MPSPTSTALAALALAFFAKSYTRPPHPYDDRGVDTIPDAIMDALPGNPKGSASPPIYEGAWAPNDRLQKATRLFEGVVVGSESAAAGADTFSVALPRRALRRQQIIGSGPRRRQPRDHRPLRLGVRIKTGEHKS